MPARSQEASGIGEWQTYLSYAGGQTVAEGEDRYYAGTNHGLYAFNTKENNLVTYTPQQGFSGIDITTMRYHEPTRQLFIAYESGLIDVIKDGTDIRTLTAIADKNIVGAKEVLAFTFSNGTAYIATTFGLVTYDLGDQTFGSTFFGPLAPQWRTTSLARLQDTLFAATEQGLLKAPAQGVNLQDVNVWELERANTLGAVTSYQDELYFQADSQLLIRRDGQWSPLGIDIDGEVDLNKDQGQLLISRSENSALAIGPAGKLDTLDANSANRVFLDKKGNLWYGKGFFPLLKREKQGDLQFFLTDGPGGSDAWSVSVQDQTLYATAGGYGDNFSATFNPTGFYKRNPDGSWKNYNRLNSDSLARLDIRDFVNVAADPQRDRFFAASFENGLVSYRNGEFFRHYTPRNSGLSFARIGGARFLRVADVTFDQDGNLWMTNNAANEPLVCLTSEGEWFSFPLNGVSAVLDLIIDDEGRKWMRTQGNGVVVYDDNGTIPTSSDDQVRQLTDQDGRGGLPSSTVLSLAADKEGNIWVGTTDGIGVFFSTRRLFDRAISAQEVFVNQGEEAGLLLSGEQVTAIAVDGGNNKWFGTPNGVLYTTPSGDEVLNRFTADNSPLLSSSVRDIAIDGTDGQVYFATNSGLVSYRSRATEGSSQYNDVYAFPNPVQPGYNGTIAIKGLVANVSVKITDATGNLVKAVQANGGQAVWDGRNRSGQRVNSGVYYVYATDEQGNQTKVTKILVMN
jgi:ligand-binding sensor domain-containing protein